MQSCPGKSLPVSGHRVGSRFLCRTFRFLAIKVKKRLNSALRLTDLISLHGNMAEWSKALESGCSLRSLLSI